MEKDINFCPKEKQLVLVSASIAAGCRPCTVFMINKAKEMNIPEDEIRQAINNAVSVCESAKEAMKAYGMELLGVTKENNKCCDGGECEVNPSTNRIKELTSIAAAFAVNCTSNLEKHIASGKSIGITDNEIKVVLDSALFIKKKAMSHVDKIAQGFGVESDNDNNDTTRKTKGSDACCG